ncbi:required for meiotic nuclear division protein 1 homolog [Sabethes cyaneus]|uniref:required for meiotic nuclear division protein 1 homolog n=1 Tax=Sabethes cyaneus TaxID=53552 RepID=UPI00237ED434|nr:required for meiotic nuclear division protein 1 homolog [Sabethes cyaneus]XP_053694714.1 required for meiotic nuclear division protein 1 homolog [Sabethes cyaneus]XP_053694715.1 required for meiotic nuclear division protein 1 homolog [Sabethes cyaneus]
MSWVRFASTFGGRRVSFMNLWIGQTIDTGCKKKLCVTLYATLMNKIDLCNTKEKIGKEQCQNIALNPLKLHDNTQLKIRPRRKREEENVKHRTGYFGVTAFATAEQYHLESLECALQAQNLYESKQFLSSEEYKPDVLHVTAKYKLVDESRDVYFFREGTVVFWNCTDLEIGNILRFLKPFEKDAYDETTVLQESEVMLYNTGEAIARLKNDSFYISKNDDSGMERYTYSNAMSLTVKLGIWEASLERYIESMAYVTGNLKKGRSIQISRSEMLRKTGELFALRHLINLSSDLLDVPDFYWDREQLEKLYQQTCSYFSISRRTRVMNEKLNHCIDLADLINSNLNDTHHVRLEWMIIFLIMVEVGFEILHYIEKIP